MSLVESGRESNNTPREAEERAGRHGESMPPNPGPSTQQRRIPALHRRRDLKMARNAHAYVRGSTQKFYEWLDSTQGRSLPEGPRIWICGDAHVGNLGPIARCSEGVEVELRDLDQTVPGNPVHDLVRLALSLGMAARSSDLPGVVTARLVEELMAGYLEAFVDPSAPEQSSSSAAVRFVVREALRRRWRHLHRDRIGKRPKFPIGERFLPLDAQERADVQAFLSTERVRKLVTRIECRDERAKIRVVDAAYWVKGCSSLGLWRCAALVEVIGHERGGGYSLLDLKGATKPIAPASSTDELPLHHGDRVVKGALALAPALGERMLAGTVAGHAIFVRELMPQDLKLELEMFDDAEARATARALARIVGVAHARQLDPNTRDAWRQELERSMSRSIEAPGWLWSSVVDLIGIHERAYLEHCRRYALTEEKKREDRVRAAEKAE
ncbi:MAG TPA: DUF2252 family protein [Polyangiaceae bacterium]|nr:DUF2252 family protein [Polyangiaceae bacterium]